MLIISFIFTTLEEASLNRSLFLEEKVRYTQERNKKEAKKKLIKKRSSRDSLN